MRFLQETLFVHSVLKSILAGFNEEAPENGLIVPSSSVPQRQDVALVERDSR